MAVAVLLLNDHLLKWEFGSWWTGKLSDLAGIFLLPLLLVGLWRLRPHTQLLPSAKRGGFHAAGGATEKQIDNAALVVTGLGFALVKTVPAIDRGYEMSVGTIRWLARSVPTLLGGDLPNWRPIIVTPDVTDLLVLPILVASWWILRRCRQETGKGVNHP